MTPTATIERRPARARNKRTFSTGDFILLPQPLLAGARFYSTGSRPDSTRHRPVARCPFHRLRGQRADSFRGAPVSIGFPTRETHKGPNPRRALLCAKAHAP